MRIRSRIFVAAVAASVGLLSACTAAPMSEAADGVAQTTEASVNEGAPSTVEPSRTPSTTGAGAWCALVPPSLVASTLGIQLREPTASFTPDEIRCTYVPVTEGELTIGVRFRVHQDQATFAAYRESLERPAEPLLDLAGVGDEAFYRTNEFDIQVTHIVVARVGTVVVQLEAPGTLEDCTALVQAVLAKLV